MATECVKQSFAATMPFNYAFFLAIVGEIAYIKF